jgi:hypothetical protein
LAEASPNELRNMPRVLARVDAVRRFRLGIGPNSSGEDSKKDRAEGTKTLADKPTRFHVEHAPTAPYLVLPRHSSETRAFIPLGYLDANSLAGDANLVSDLSTRYELGILSSTMHNAWVRYTCGRIKSDFRYSKDIVYNNLPWPDSPSGKQRTAIETAAQGVLDARAQFPDASLADLYDPLTMPPALVKAHQKLDAVVDAAYLAKSNRKGFKSDAERVAFLFELYQKYTSLLPAGPAPKRSRSRAPSV